MIISCQLLRVSINSKINTSLECYLCIPLLDKIYILNIVLLMHFFIFIFGCSESSMLHATFLYLQCAWFSLWQWLLLLPSMGLIASRHAVSSRTRNRTHDPCVGKQIPHQWTIREAQHPHRFLKLIFVRVQSLYNVLISSMC